MKRSRFANAAMAALFLAITIMVPVRGMLSRRATATGDMVVFHPDEAIAASRTAQWILLALFGSLTLAFAWRAMTSDAPDDDGRDDPDHEHNGRSRPQR